jgi:hypothetical protein
MYSIESLWVQYAAHLCIDETEMGSNFTYDEIISLLTLLIGHFNYLDDTICQINPDMYGQIQCGEEIDWGDLEY